MASGDDDNGMSERYALQGRPCEVNFVFSSFSCGCSGSEQPIPGDRVCRRHWQRARTAHGILQRSCERSWRSPPSLEPSVGIARGGCQHESSAWEASSTHRAANLPRQGPPEKPHYPRKAFCRGARARAGEVGRCCEICEPCKVGGTRRTPSSRPVAVLTPNKPTGR